MSSIKRKTCLITNQYPPQVGGVGHSTYRVANLLRAYGMEVHVVVLQKHPEQLPFDESCDSTPEDDVLVHRIKVFHPTGNDRGHNAEVLTRYNREMFQALAHFQDRYQYDVLHAFFLYPSGYVAGLVGKLKGVKTIVSIRGNDIGKYAFDPLRLPFIRASLVNADQVTSVASSLVELADRTIAQIHDKTTTILNSVDLAKVRADLKPGLDLKGMVIGTAGLFRYKKGLIYLFKALASLRGHLSFTLLLAGDYFSPEDRQLHEAYLSDLGLKEHTVITGVIPRESMADYLQLFDVLVFPSLYSEGCPLSLLEGMCLKKAIIASRSGAIPEFVRHGENGLLVDVASSKAIASAIERLYHNIGLKESLGRRAFETAEKMSPARERAEWISVYEKLEAGRSGPSRGSRAQTQNIKDVRYHDAH